MHSERVCAAESGTSWLKSWSGIGAIFLMFAAAALLAGCGGSEPSAESEELAGGEEVVFTDFDVDESGDLDENEFYSGGYDSWDTDNNGVLEEDEFTSGVETWYDDYNYDEYGEYEDWDVDGNGEISGEEFDESIVDTSLYEEWDADDNEIIDENEFSDAMEKPAG